MQKFYAGFVEEGIHWNREVPTHPAQFEVKSMQDACAWTDE